MSGIYYDYAVFRCPACRERVRIDGVQPFHERLRDPEPFGCPRCSAPVIWALSPIRVFQAGQWLLVLGFAPIFVDGFAFWSVVTFGVAGLLLGAGMLSQRLVLHEPSGAD